MKLSYKYVTFCGKYYSGLLLLPLFGTHRIDGTKYLIFQNSTQLDQSNNLEWVMIQNSIKLDQSKHMKWVMIQNSIQLDQSKHMEWDMIPNFQPQLLEKFAM